MRPIRKKPLPRLAVYDADRLMSVIGLYCSLCERPILDSPAIWDTQRDRIIPRIGDASGETLLMLCFNCAEWQELTAGTRAELLLPDGATTFRLNEHSPYRYSLERVTVRIIDDESGQPVDTTERELAIVSGSVPAAVRTIERFRLNTPYYDASQRAMIIPRSAAHSIDDRRVALRTDAWNTAVRLVPTVRQMFENHPATAHETLRVIVESAGFWSVWLTVLREHIPDRNRLLRIFAPESTTTRLHGTSTEFLD